MLPLTEIIMAMWPGIDANFEVQLLQGSDGVQDLSKFVRTDACLPPGEWATLGATLATEPAGTTQRHHFMAITLKQVSTAAGVKHRLYFHDGSVSMLRRVDLELCFRGCLICLIVCLQNFMVYDVFYIHMCVY